MRKIIASVLLTVIISLSLPHNTVGNAEEEQVNVNNNASVNKFELIYKNKKFNMLNTIGFIKNTPIPTEMPKEGAEEVERPQYDNINLDPTLLNFIWDLSQKDNFSYALILGIAYLESNFNINEVSSTQDFGLLQINKHNIKAFADGAGIEGNVNALDPKQNVEMAMYYLTTIRDYWRDHGLSDEDTYFMTVLSYHRGIKGAGDWVKEYGWNNAYVRVVNKYKDEIEQNIFLKDGGED